MHRFKTRYRVFAVFMFVMGCLTLTLARASGVDHGVLPEAAQVAALLRQPEEKMDLARVMLTIDKMIDPRIDIEATILQLDAIVSKVRAMAGPRASSNQKLAALRAYLYEKGPWNGYQAHQYDFDDPRGTKISNKLLPNYLASKKGNCVSMPMLFVILGQRLGIDVTISTSPEHYFVKYTDSVTGVTYNLETTSGAKPARDEWIRQQMPMTDQAIASGIYMQKLTMRETVAAMAAVLSENFSVRNEPEKMIAIIDAVLPYYPKNVALILGKGSAYSKIIKRDFASKYPRPMDIPAEDRSHYSLLAGETERWYAKAETLGWREPGKEQQTHYMQVLNHAKSNQ